MGAAGPGCWVRGRAGRGGGWERESEPVDEPTLLEESEPERQGKKRRRGTEKEEGEEEGGRRDRRLSLQLCVKTCNIHHALMVESKAGQRSCRHQDRAERVTANGFNIFLLTGARC